MSRNSKQNRVIKSWVGTKLDADYWQLSIDLETRRGGYATVWSATDRRNGSEVALKVLRPELTKQNPDLAQARYNDFWLRPNY